MRKNILILSYQYPPTMGGAGIVAQDTARIFNKNHKVTVVTLDKNQSAGDAFPIIPASTQWPFRFIGFWKTIRQLELAQFDEIIVNDTGASLVAALYFPKNIMAKCWIYLHGSEPENIFLRPELMFKLLGFKSKYIRLLNECRHVVAVSDYMKEKFLSLTALNHLSNKISVVTNGVDSELFYPRSVDLRKKFNLKPDTKILLSVGRLTAKKGYLRKLQLFHRLRQEHEAHWIIIGQGAFKQELLSAIQSKNLQQSVTIITALEREELAEYYSGADLFWLLSDYDESFGLVYLEANFCGCPVLGNDKGGVPYIIETGTNGFLVTSADEHGAFKQLERTLFKETLNHNDITSFAAQYSLQNVQNRLQDMLGKV